VDKTSGSSPVIFGVIRHMQLRNESMMHASQTGVSWVAMKS